jgi:hypothetical protein
MLVLRNRCDRKIQVFPRLGEPVLFQTKNNLKGEDLRYDCYYY